MLTDLTIADFMLEAIAWGLPRPRAERVVRETVEDLSRAMDGIDRDRFPGVTPTAWSRVTDQIERAGSLPPR